MPKGSPPLTRASRANHRRGSPSTPVDWLTTAWSPSRTTRCWASTEAAGIWTIQSGIFAENTASLAVHASVGFVVVGRRARLGRMTYGPLTGQWRDVIMMERRSEVID